MPARIDIPLKLTLHRDTYLITTRFYTFPLDLRTRERRGFGEDLRSNAHDASALKFFAKRRARHASPRAGQEETGRNWHSLHGSADGGSSAGGNPVRYADCAATSSYRNESIETLPRRYAGAFRGFCYPLSLVRRCALDIPIKLWLIRVTRQLNISPFARRGHRESCPAILNPDREFCAYSLLLSYTHAPIARMWFAQSCATLRAEEQLDALPPFLDLRGISFSRKDYSYRNPALCFRENRRMEFSAITVERPSSFSRDWRDPNKIDPRL